MSTPPSSPLLLTASQAVGQIETEPLTLEAWRSLLARVKSQGDALSSHSLEVIIEGVEAAIKAPAESSRLQSRERMIFIRLAKAYNNPLLFQEIGTVYLKHFELPAIAQRHFERALRLGGSDKTLRPLIEAADVAEQKRRAKIAGISAHTGISIAPSQRPSANQIIVETGMRLSSHTNWNDAPPPSGKEVDDSTVPVPSSTSLCLEAAEKAIEEGRLKQALGYLLEANKRPLANEIMWKAWGKLGFASHEARRYDYMDQAFTHALAFGPGDIGTYFNAGLGSHLNQRFDAALENYLKAAEMGESNSKVWCNLGVLFFQMNRYVNSEAALRRSTELDPTYARAWDNLAATLVALNRIDEALEACASALDLRPDYPEANFKRGVIFFQRLDLSLAAEAFRKAASLPPLTGHCQSYLSSIYSQLEQPEAAQEAVRRAVETNPQCDLLWMAWNDLGLAWYETSQYGRAAAAYAEATVLKPEETRTWFNLGVTYHRSGDLAAARDAYQQAIDLPNSFTKAWHNLGLVCAELGDLRAAREAFLEEVNRDPTNGRAWYDFGVCLEKLGLHDESRDAFARAEDLGRFATAPVPHSVHDEGLLKD